MERIISQEERIRRAEEIYNRRRSGSSTRGVRVSSDTVNVNGKKTTKLFKKMALQLAICSVIYIIFYLIKNTNYIFSDDVIAKTKEFLSYDINFNNLYQQATLFIDENKEKFNFTTNSVEDANVVDVNTVEANTISEQEQTNGVKENNSEAGNNEIKANVVGGIGGAEENEIVEENKVIQTSSTTTVEKTQMEIDAEYVKKNYSIKSPLNGTVTSRYGEREATEIVSANHKGIDIGANEGTYIFAAMDGKVTLASSEGDYGKHLKIEDGEVMTLYAHCSELLVKEGEAVKQGQKIAKVGSTGKATGPHLHFEIRRQNRTINPEYILKF